MIVSIPEDIYAYDAKVFGNLTKRQGVCLLLSVIVVLGSFLPILFWTQSSTLAGMAAFVLAVPLFFCALIKKEGQPFEQIVRYRLNWKRRCHKRAYHMSNCYEEIQNLAKEYEQIEKDTAEKKTSRFGRPKKGERKNFRTGKHPL